MVTTYTIGPFHLDSEAAILFRGDEPVALGRRAITLLGALVKRPGIPVSKNTLIEAAWAGLSVEESNLAVQIASLRRVFGATPGGERWIETLPGRGYRFVGPVDTGDQGAAAARSLVGAKPALPAPALEKFVPPRLSIVVLPFVNIGGDPEQEYFVDGVSESLTTDLARIAGAFVIARNTAFTFKGKKSDATGIGRELNVRYVLEGSVQRAGDRMRVNVQLIDAESGNHLWAERFDKPVADFFVMQDEIVARVCGELDAELIAVEARRAERTPNPDAFDHASPEWAARLASAEALLFKALLTAPDNAMAHMRLSWVRSFSNRAAQGIAEAERALALNPNLALAFMAMGQAKLFAGHAEDTESYVQHALHLSPRDTTAFAWMALAGAAKLCLGAYIDAEEWLKQSVTAYPNYPLAHFVLAATLGQLGRAKEARAEVDAGLALNPAFTISRFRDRAESDNPIFLEQRSIIYDGLRQAGVLEG